MKIGILNEKHGIVVVDGLEDLGYIQIELIEKQMPKGAKLSDLAFFYMADRDWIVINRDHALFEFYSEIMPIYLELSSESRKKCMEEKTMASFKEAFSLLNSVIRYRRLLNGKCDGNSINADSELQEEKEGAA